MASHSAPNAISDRQAKRLCYIVPNLGHMGGSVRVAIDLANRFSREGFSVSMISCAPFERPAFALEDGISTHALDLGSGRLRDKTKIARKPLGEILRAENPSLLFGIGTYETLFSIRACRDVGVPLVFCDHGALVNQWDDKQMRVIRLLGALFSAKTVTLTNKSLEDYASMLHVPRRKLRCIPNWIPRVLTETQHVYDVQSRRLLWAGRLDKEKGVDHLIEIAKRVLPSRPDWTWDVYGQRVVMEGGFDVEQAVQEAGLTGRLRLMGRSDNLFELYDKHAACTLTSYREGLPLTLLEGKACGLPLISFDVNTGPRDIIEDGIDGYLVSPYDYEEYAEKLGWLMDSDSLRASMSQASQRTVGRFSEDEIFAQWVSLVEELTA